MNSGGKWVKQEVQSKVEKRNSLGMGWDGMDRIQLLWIKMDASKIHPGTSTVAICND